MSASAGSRAADAPARWQRLLFWLVLAGAAAVRFWNLDHIPEGFHGDEAWTGIDARRILAEGWIGPYVPAALGQPTGPLYWIAALFLVLPEDIWTIRAGIACIGVLGVAFTYLTARAYEGRFFALCAATLLAGSLWHLHASRIGMMFVSCVTMLMAGLWAQAVALREPRWVYSAVAGAVAGLGVYSYNAYPTATPLYAVPFLYALAAAPSGGRRVVARKGAIFAASALLAALPMISFAAADPQGYFRHHQQVSVFAAAKWTGGDWPARVAMLRDRAHFWLEGLFINGNFDAGDGFGVAEIPLVDPITTGLAAVGVAVALLRWRHCLSGLMLTAVPLISVGALLTDGPGAFRRTIALAPFVAMLAATTLTTAYRLASVLSQKLGWRIPHAAAGVAALLLVGSAARIGVTTYFGPFVNDRLLKWVYARELRIASEFLAGVPRDTRVYFFSERWGCNYETRRFLAPGIDCVDRSRRFGTLTSRSGLLDFSTKRDRPALIFLMAEHTRHLDNMLRRHPGAQHVSKKIGGETIYAAVTLPEGVARNVGVPAAKRDLDGPIVPVAALDPVDVRYDFEPPRVDLSWNGQPILIGGKTYERGLGMHAPTEMVYGVPRGATALRATVGLADRIADCAKASVVFEIASARGTVLASSGVMRPGDAPRQLRADLRGVRRVVLTSGDAGDGRDCDHANWGNPVFVRPRSGAAPATKSAGNKGRPAGPPPRHPAR